MEYNIVGIISEYDPFHNGHKKQVDYIKKHLNADFVISVMSGPFMQRGELSTFSINSRAKMALSNGVDMVFELPCLYSLRDADMFAFAGVSILEKLGFVNAISFGCENDKIDNLIKAANLLENESDIIGAKIEDNLNTGISYAKARALSLEKIYGKEISEIISKPNNILAVSYIRALQRIKSKIALYPILRDGDYHANDIDIYSPSASYIRNACKQGNIKNALECCPKNSIEIIKDELLYYNIALMSNLDKLLLYKINGMSLQALSEVPGVSEGLENKIKQAAKSSLDINSLIFNIKSKRYTHARIRRILSYILLDINKMDIAENINPNYVRLLGYTERSKELFKKFKYSNINIISDNSYKDDKRMAFDKRAYEVWDISANKNIGSYYTTKMIVV